MGRSITAKRKQQLDDLFEAFNLIADGTYVYLCDMKYDYSRWSKTAVDTFGLPDEYMYAAGDIWEEHIHEDDRDSYHRSIEAIFSGADSGHDMQYRAKKSDGQYEVCTCRGVVIRDSKGAPSYFAGAIRNHGIQGHIDNLTGLRNQYGFFEDMKIHIEKQRTVAICMVGIGKFTEINEVYGYHFGNKILQRFGRILLEQVGNRGSVYRMDGTKFAVISGTQTAGDMTDNYEALRATFRDGVTIDDKCIVFELNGGLLTLNNFLIDDQTAYSCLNFAYSESKNRKQGDLVEFYNDLNSENRQRIEKLHVIRVSITQAFRGYSLFYQPVVNARTEKLIGAEALLRWSSPEYGMVPPDLFIPLLETDPLFPQLGEWILMTAVSDARRVLAMCPEFVVNVNLSYAQIEKADFPDMVLNVLEETGFPPEHLCLEITERCRLLDIELLKNVIIRLKSHGIKFALDDFGTGFSSMGIIKNLPFDTIKIDRSFVIKIEDDPKERELIEHFSNVAATFDAKV
ncbi:MAG: EAL domain-containing protein, partial [Lachnospiraceae bacterium]|nr:EAL domain-containing protein [Lachnospiraceae bacterium]